MLNYLLIVLGSLLALYLITVILTFLTIINLEKEGYDAYSWKDSFNLGLAFSFISGTVFHKLIPEHILEQYVIRLYDPYCKARCYDSEDGKCIDCGCDAVKKAYAPTASCSKGNWGPIIFSKEDYNKLREEYPIKIKVQYGKVSK